MLAAKKQFEKQAMGNIPLSVIRCNGKSDYQKIYDAGVQAGNGTQEERNAFRDLLTRWDEVDGDLKEEQLRLSSNTHYVYLPDCGHNIQLIRPDVVAEEVKWILANLVEDG
jgi:poly(3-hydroxybutyrate) depolymerase